MKNRFYLLAIVSALISFIKSQSISLLLLSGDVGKQTTYFIQFNNFKSWNNNSNTPPFTLNIKVIFQQEFDQGSSQITVERPSGIHQVNYQLDSNQNYSFVDIVEVKSYTTTLNLNSFYNPPYSGNYSIKYQVSDSTTMQQFETITQIYAIQSQNQMQLNFSESQPTNTLGLLSLLINPTIPLPKDAAINITLPQYSSQKPQLNFITNPVVCRQKQKQVGDPDILCQVNQSNQLVISSILAQKQTTIVPLQLEILNVLSPFSTLPVGDFPIVVYGFLNNRPIQQESGNLVSVKVASPFKSLLIQSTSQLSLSLTSLSISIQAISFFSTSFVLSVKLPTEFPLSLFQRYNSDGRVVSLNIQSNGVILVQSNVVVPSDDSKMFLRLEGVRNYQGVFDTTTFFGVTVYQDSSLANKVYEDLTSTKYSTIVNQMSINSFSYSPQQIQTLSTYYLELQLTNSLDDTNMSQNRYTINLPSQLRFSDAMITAMLGQGQRLCSTLTDFLEFNGQLTTALCEMERDSSIRVYGFYNEQTNITIRIKQIMNPYSTEKSQPFLIVVEVQSGSNSNWLLVYQNNQAEDKTMVQAQSGEIIVQRFESTASQITFDLSSYIVSFIITSRLIPQSFIIINFPQDDFYFTYMNLANCSCEFSEGLITSKSLCTFDQRNLVQISLQSNQTLIAGQRVTVLLKGIRNPRSTKPTNLIRVQSLSPTMGLIDEIKGSTNPQNLSVRMMTSAAMLVTSVQPASFQIGDITTYTITFQTPSQILNGDTLIMGLSDLAPTSSNLQCNGIQGFAATLPCTLQNNNIVIKIATTVDASAIIQFTILQVRNPYSNVVSTPLIFQLKDSTDYLISQTSFLQVAKRGSSYGYDAVNLLSMEIHPDNLYVGRVSTFLINFSLPIPVNSNQAIIVQLASEIGLSDEPLGCFFLPKGIFQNTRAICQYQKGTHSILITNFIPPKSLRVLQSTPNYPQFQEDNQLISKERLLNQSIVEVPINTPITLSLTGIQNKITNGAFSSNDSSKMTVSICTADSNGSTYTQLATSSFNIPPSFICSQPCTNCYGIDTACISCSGSQILLPEDSLCENDCPNLYARFQTSTKYSFPVCVRCLAQDQDVNCAACTAPDLNQCTRCVQKFKLIYDSKTNKSQCEEITNDNDPLRIFVYALEFNLPYISIYIFCFSLYIIIRRIWMIKTIQLIVVLLAAYSLIESVTLIAFFVKVALLGIFLPILIGCLLLAAYFIIQFIASRKFTKSLQTDGQYTLYQPSYKVIRVIEKVAVFLNFKVFLMYRSCFSIIKDIYSIPFSNSQQHSYLMKRSLQFALIFHMCLLCFICWTMYYTYNYRNVIIPPFFFIEYSFLHLLIIIILIMLLTPNQRFHVYHLFDIVNEENNKYRITQLDLKSKPSMILAKHQQTYDHLNPQFQAASVFMTANQISSNSHIQNFASRALIPRSTNNLNTHVNIQQSQINVHEQEQKSNTYQRKNTRLNTTSIMNNNQKVIQNQISKSTIQHYDINNNPVIYNGINQHSVAVTPTHNNSINHDISPSNFNSTQEIQVQGLLVQQGQVSPQSSMIQQNKSQLLEHHMNQNQHLQREYQQSGYNQNHANNDGLNGNKFIFANNNSSGSDGISDVEIRSRNASSNVHENINRQNNHLSTEQQRQIYQSSEQKRSSSDISSGLIEQLNTGNFKKQTSHSPLQNILVTPERQRSSSGSPSPHSQSNTMIKENKNAVSIGGRTLFSKSNLKQNKQQKPQLNSDNKSLSKQSNSKVDTKYDDENHIDYEQDGENRMKSINQSNINQSNYHSQSSQNDHLKRQSGKNTQTFTSQKMVQSNLCIPQNLNFRSSSEQFSKKYTESSEEVEENHCNNAMKKQTKQSINSNAYFMATDQSNKISVPSNQNWKLKQLQEFSSPKGPFDQKMNQNNQSNENIAYSPQQSTPQIGNDNSNQFIDGQLQYQNKASPQIYTFSKKQERQFQESMNTANQNEVSPTNIDKPQLFDNNKNQPPSFSQDFNISNGKQASNNQAYSFQNTRQAQIPHQAVSRFDQLPSNDEGSQEKNRDVNNIPFKQQASHSQERFDSNKLQQNYYQNSNNPPYSSQYQNGNQNQHGDNQNKLLLLNNFVNPYASINLKHSTDSKVSDYFPS